MLLLLNWDDVDPILHMSLYFPKLNMLKLIQIFLILNQYSILLQMNYLLLIYDLMILILYSKVHYVMDLNVLQLSINILILLMNFLFQFLLMVAFSIMMFYILFQYYKQ